MSIRQEPDDPPLTDIGTTPYDDFERAYSWHSFSVPASAVDGTTGQDGGQSFDAEGNADIIQLDVDRGEVAELVSLLVYLQVYSNSTTTADGTVLGGLEVSTFEDARVVQNFGNASSSLGGSIDSRKSNVIKRPGIVEVVTAVGHSPFSDGATGVGGAGSTGEATVRKQFRDMYGSGPTFDAGSELNLHPGFIQWNIADAAIHMDATIEVVYDIHEFREFS